MKVNISLAALAEADTQPDYCRMERDSEGHLSLYNESNELCCLDGEDASVQEHTNGKYLLRNDNGDWSICFHLTDAEYAVAVFRDK